MIAAGEKLGSGRGANRADVESVETGARPSERVDIWRLNVAVAIEAEIAPALIVGEQYEDIWLLRGGCESRSQQQGQREKSANQG